MKQPKRHFWFVNMVTGEVITFLEPQTIHRARKIIAEKCFNLDEFKAFDSRVDLDERKESLINRRYVAGQRF